MTWNRIELCVGILLGFWVVVRLLSLRLHRVYRIFSAFLILELAISILGLVGGLLKLQVDYRYFWLALAAPSWLLTLWMVYALLDAILANLPGLLSFSQFLLRLAFIVAAAVSAVLVLQLAGKSSHSSSAIGQIVRNALEVEQAVGVLALLVLLGISLFVLWFPVQMARNLLIFSVGVTIYFLFRTATALGEAFLPPTGEAVLLHITMVVLPACYAYWALSISPKGEESKIRVGQSWSTAANQQRALHELEQINTALLRSVKN